MSRIDLHISYTIEAIYLQDAACHVESGAETNVDVTSRHDMGSAVRHEQKSRRVPPTDGAQQARLNWCVDVRRASKENKMRPNYLNEFISLFEAS